MSNCPFESGTDWIKGKGWHVPWYQRLWNWLTCPWKGPKFEIREIAPVEVSDEALGYRSEDLEIEEFVWVSEVDSGVNG